MITSWQSIDQSEGSHAPLHAESIRDDLPVLQIVFVEGSLCHSGEATCVFGLSSQHVATELMSTDVLRQIEGGHTETYMRALD